MTYPDPVSLKLFVAVCEVGSLAGAADRECLSPSALSKRISDLEAELGTTLLTREPRGVRMTAAGETLLLHARQILHSLAQMQAEVGEYGVGIRGHVRVLSVVTAMVEFLPESLATFLGDNAHVRISLDEGVTAQVLRSVENGSADIGICREVPVPNGLLSYPCGSDRFAVVVHPQHELACRTSVAFHETLAYEHVALSLNAALQPPMEKLARDMDREVNIRLYVSSFDAALRVIKSGHALGIFPVEAIARFRALYDLRVIALDETWASGNFMLCARPAEVNSLVTRRLIAHLLHERQPSKVTTAATQNDHLSVLETSINTGKQLADTGADYRAAC